MVSPLLAKRTLADIGDVPSSSGPSSSSSGSAGAAVTAAEQRPTDEEGATSSALRKPKTVREAHEAAEYAVGAVRWDQQLQTVALENRNLKPVIAAVYGYLNDRGDAGDDVGETPILVTRTTDCWTSAHMVPSRGADPCAVLVLEGEMAGIGADAANLPVRLRACADGAEGRGGHPCEAERGQRADGGVSSV